MMKIIYSLTRVYPSVSSFHVLLLLFRIAVSIQLIIAHGLKKIGVGAVVEEQIPNPLHLPDTLNNLFAISSNLFFPVLVIFGVCTRIAVLPILAVTLTGYFVVHWTDPIPQKDVPFMYSICYLVLLILGPGKYSVDYYLNRKIRL